jgi:hypothetical protein
MVQDSDGTATTLGTYSCPGALQFAQSDRPTLHLPVRRPVTLVNVSWVSHRGFSRVGLGGTYFSLLPTRRNAWPSLRERFKTYSYNRLIVEQQGKD